jgi:hypothetical protein
MKMLTKYSQKSETQNNPCYHHAVSYLNHLTTPINIKIILAHLSTRRCGISATAIGILLANQFNKIELLKNLSVLFLLID